MAFNPLARAASIICPTDERPSVQVVCIWKSMAGGPSASQALRGLSQRCAGRSRVMIGPLQPSAFVGDGLADALLQGGLRAEGEGVAGPGVVVDEVGHLPRNRLHPHLPTVLET